MEDLEEHLKSFGCDICSSTYASLSLYRTHKDLMHADEGDIKPATSAPPETGKFIKTFLLNVKFV